MLITWSLASMGAYWGCLSSSVIRSPRWRVAWVALSRSLPNWEKAASSRYWARSMRSRPATCFMAPSWAEPPTRLTDRPTFTAGRMPELNSSVSRKIWPSVMEMTLVGM